MRACFIARSNPETVFFRMLKLPAFKSETSIFFLSARKSIRSETSIQAFNVAMADKTNQKARMSSHPNASRKQRGYMLVVRPTCLARPTCPTCLARPTCPTCLACLARLEARSWV
jgi:hypothetical protein